MKNIKKALVLGATGGVGGEVARSLMAHGWQVTALVRKKDIERLEAGITWVQGDAMNADDVCNAAEGVSLIVHAVNPPGYKNWSQVVLPMIDSTIKAAKLSRARILLPGTIYNYGSGTCAVLNEQTPQNPSTRKGTIRVEMEQRLLKASQQGVQVLIVRCGDFYGPRPGNNWFSQGLVKPGHPVASISYPGKKGVGHSWAYLPDVAETMVRLAEQGERLSTFESFHFGGHWDSDGTQMIKAIAHESGQAKVNQKSMPWFLLKLLSPFVLLFREMNEMKYLWQEPFRLENKKLIDFLGEEPQTQLNQAVRETLQGLGCLGR